MSSGRNLDEFLDNNYKPQGHIQKLPDGVEFYGIGSTESKKSVVIVPDLFGWNTGRTRNLADYLAANGFYVLVPGLMARTSGGHASSQGEEEEHAFPNLFDFSRMGDYMKTLAYDSTLKPKFESLAHHLDNCGLEKNAILSFSWGGWVTAHVLSDPALANKYTCAAIAHPSITLEERIFGGNTAELMNKIQKPLLLIPCKGDPDEYRAGGALFEPLKHRLNTSEVLDLPDVEHGFLPRGKVTNQKNFDALHKTMNKVLEFFNNHAN